MSFNEIHNYLYKKHYLNYIKSNSISVHWDDYLSKYKVTKIGKKIDKIKNFFLSINLFFFLNKYKVSKKIINKGKELNKINNFNQNFDIVKNYKICDLIIKNNLLKNNSIICIIGDGYGYLGQLLKFLKLDLKIIYVNLGTNLLIDSYYYSTVFKNEKPLLINETNIDKVNNSSIILVEAENANLLNNINIDLFINIASMQEMNMSIIKDYFKIIRNNKKKPFFYCCNRIEKNLRDGSIIKFNDYPWSNLDKVIFEEDCEWYSSYPSLMPFYWKHFNGKLKHKLVEMNLFKASKQNEQIR